MPDIENGDARKARQTQSLDGTWDIAFDPENEGRGRRWTRRQDFPGDRAQAIPVPSCWELTEKDYEGVAFYRHTFTVPAEWEGKVVRLHFDAVNFLAEVWLNDSAVGVHEGGFTPFEFRVDDVLAFGEENTLILRVAGPILLQDKQVDGVGPLETPQWRGAITGGIWQSVTLIATGNACLEDVFIEPKVTDSEVTFHMMVSHAASRSCPARVAVVVRSTTDPASTVDHVEEAVDLKPGRNRRDLTVQIPDAVLWSPENPHLYHVEISVAIDDVVSDTWSARFGMREFTISDKQFCLNGTPIYLKATFFEGLYPVGLAVPDSREMAVREIRLAKEAGFNMIRPWRKPPPLLWLDLCDELGVLTVGSLAVECMDFPVESARLPGWVENEVRESIMRDRSRTCVVQWELFNELKRPVLKRLLHPMSMLARELDPTRLILDESGGWAQGAGMYLPYESEPTRFNDIHNYPGPQINDQAYTKLLLAGSITHEEMRDMGLKGRLPGDNVIPGLMTSFSELGYGSLPDLVDNNQRFADIGNPLAPPTVYHRRLADQHRQVLKESGFDRIYPDLQLFCLDQQYHHGVANRRMIEAVRCNPNVSGYCVHALTAGNWIIGAGLLDLFRNPKTYAYEGTKAASQPRILSIRVRPRNVYAERGTAIDITAVNEMERVRGSLKVDVIDSSGDVIFSRSVAANPGQGITSLFNEPLDTSALRGTYSVQAVLTDADGAVVAENAYNFDVFGAEQLAVPRQGIAVLDPGGSLRPFLAEAGITFDDFSADADRALPVLVSTTEACTSEERECFRALCEFVTSGGTAVYLGGGGPRVEWGKPVAVSPLLPVEGRQKISVATWNGVPHLVVDHPVFDGLPTDCIMGPVYENVWADRTLLDVGGETVAGAIGYDWFPDYELRRRHYYGPGATWWGADVAIVPVGSGRCIVSQLRLIENLGKDPVADRILHNLIRVAAG